jgi:hypothetical protein
MKRIYITGEHIYLQSEKKKKKKRGKIKPTLPIKLGRHQFSPFHTKRSQDKIMDVLFHG